MRLTQGHSQSREKKNGREVQARNGTENHGREEERYENKPKKQIESEGKGEERLNHVVNVLLGSFELLQLKARVCMSELVRVSGERHASPTNDPVNIEDGRRATDSQAGLMTRQILQWTSLLDFYPI